MKSKHLAGLMFAFSIGVLGKTAVDHINYEFVSPAYADVAGMSHRELSRDRDFRRAVMTVVSSYCYVYGVSGGDGYISC